MADPAAQAPELTPAAPAGQPVMSAAEIEALVDRKAQALSDQRVAGLQSLFDRKMDALSKQVTTLSRATLSESEIEAQGQSELRAELEQARRERDALRAAQKYGPEATQAYLNLISASDAEEQVALLAKLIAPKAAASPQSAAEPVVPSHPVDPNNPARQPDLGPEQVMDQSTADRIINSMRGMKWPGL